MTWGFPFRVFAARRDQGRRNSKGTSRTTREGEIKAAMPNQMLTLNKNSKLRNAMKFHNIFKLAYST